MGHIQSFGYPYPMVPGSEPVGRVLAIDPEMARQWGIGEGSRVVVESFMRCGVCRECRGGQGNFCRNLRIHGLIPLSHGPGLWGGMSQYLYLDRHSTPHLVPDDLPAADAVFAMPLANVFHWICTLARVGVGDRVLILGGGQRGIAGAIAAKEAGAAEIIVTGLTRDAHKLELALACGATRVVDVERESLRDAVGDPVDVIADFVPATAAPLTESFDLLRPEGTVVLIGTKAPGEPIGLPYNRVFAKGLRIIGAFGKTPWSVRTAIRIIASHRYPIERLHSHRLPLADVDRALRILGNEVPEEHPVHMTLVP